MDPIYALLYLAFVNVFAFTVYGVDKYCARHGHRRVSEKRLFLLAAVGGSVGALAGMYTFRHKTRHWYFVWGIPAILVLQVALLLWLTV